MQTEIILPVYGWIIAFWPFVTTKLYIDQTGDMDVLFEKIPYFKDLQSKRGTTHDEEWNTAVMVINRKQML